MTPTRRGSWSSAVVGALVIGIVAIGAAACGENTSSPHSSRSANEQVRIAFLPLVQANPYVAATLKGIQEVARKENASVSVYDANLDASKQFSQCQDVVSSRRFDAIITIPVNQSIAPCLKQAIAAGVKVVNTDFPVGPDPMSGKPQLEGQTAAVIDAPPLRGKAISGLIIKACGATDPCQVAIITGLISDPYSQAVIQIAKTELKAHPNITLVGVRQAQYLPGPAVGVTQDLLQSYPKLRVIATTSDPMTLGAEKAVNAAGLKDKVILIGGGAERESFTAIPSGRWFGTFLALPFTEGQLGAKYAIQAARGAQLSVGVSAVQRVGLSPEITKTNIARVRSKIGAGQW